MRSGLSFRTTTAAIVGYAIAMAYLEAAVVVYLQTAIGSQIGVLFPLKPELATGNLLAIEVGREVVTLVMIGSVGALAGRTGLERLAWSAAVFGVWDVGYYGWLHVFSGWPPAPDTPDLLFLLPVPWVGPVWSPVVVSGALVGFGLAAARRLRGGHRLALARRHVAAGCAGGLLVVLSFTLDTPRIVAGGLPGPFAWPLFAAGMLLAVGAAADVLRRARPDERSART